MNRDEKIICWARQWAEHVDDERVLKMWKDGVCLVCDYGDYQFDLRKKKRKKK